MPDIKKTEQNQQITPAQRNMYFNQLTRQHIQAGPGVAFTEGQTVSLEVPKARLLSKILLKIEGAINFTHAADVTVATLPNAPFDFIRKVEVNLNNGFSPYVVTGMDILALNMIQTNGNMVAPVITTGANALVSRAKNKMGNSADTAANGGADNILQMILELPLTLNDRDPAGLIMLQAPDVLVNINVTFGTVLTNICTAAAQAGATFTAGRITPIYETYSIPVQEQARPDLSILKLVHSRTENITAAGLKTINLPTGYMYRKLLVWVRDAAGAGITDTALNTNFDIILNTADKPYSIPHDVIAERNQQDYGVTLPSGLFVFDFTRNAGIPNFGSARDYIDTAQLTEFELQFTATAAGTVSYIYETLSVLKKS